MKAITVTQELKDNNPELFSNYAVGSIATINPPNRFVREIEGAKFAIYGYDYNENEQFADGFKTIVRPNITNLQKYGKLVEQEKHFVYEILDKSEQELDALIASQVPTLYFNLQLLELGVTEQNVIDTIKYAHNNGLLSADVNESLKIKDALILKWTKSNVIERDFPELYSLIPLVNQVAGSNLTQEQIKQIFVSYDE